MPASHLTRPFFRLFHTVSDRRLIENFLRFFFLQLIWENTNQNNNFLSESSEQYTVPSSFRLVSGRGGQERHRCRGAPRVPDRDDTSMRVKRETTIFMVFFFICRRVIVPRISERFINRLPHHAVKNVATGACARLLSRCDAYFRCLPNMRAMRHRRAR